MAPNRPEDSLIPEVMEQPMVDYDHFINDFSQRRQPSVIRELSKWSYFRGRTKKNEVIFSVLTSAFDILDKLYSQKNSDTISFAGGLPHPSTFPFLELSVKLSDGSGISLKGKALQDSLQYIPTQG